MRSVPVGEIPSVPAEALVECPRCGGVARVIVAATASEPSRLTCGRCGLARTAELARWNRRRAGVDGVFGLPLVLQATCCGGMLLWADNERHLDYLEAFVASTDRDNDFPSPPGARGLSYKLPAWMQTAAHREELLRVIRRMRKDLAARST